MSRNTGEKNRKKKFAKRRLRSTRPVGLHSRRAWLPEIEADIKTRRDEFRNVRYNADSVRREAAIGSVDS
jgi:hypothetical protein